MELTDEVLKSMEVGMAFRDYVCLCMYVIVCYNSSYKILKSLYALQNGRISSMDFHRATSYLVTASDDESIRLYDVQNAM